MFSHIILRHFFKNPAANARPLRGRVLIIAGSDCSGGAGIQADVKTVTALGGYAMTAITAITVQDTKGVHAVHAVPVDVVCQQIKVVLQDIGADVIKTGMLGDAELIEAVADTLARYAKGVPLIVDPVMVAKGGASLLPKSGVDALKRSLILNAHLITPNVPEAEILSGMSILQDKDMEKAAALLRTMGAANVLLKGGHLVGDMVRDVFLSEMQVDVFSRPRLDSQHTHGTGCTLASAIATRLAQGAALKEAVEQALAYVNFAIQHAPGFGHGHGPLNHVHALGFDLARGS